MGRTPQRGGRWSLRQVSIAAGVSQAAGKAAARLGHLDAGSLSSLDVLVLKVAASLSSFQPAGELRPANQAREVPARDIAAVGAVRSSRAHLSAEAALIVTAADATLASTFLGVSQKAAALASEGQPYMVLPVGAWAAAIPGVQV